MSQFSTLLLDYDGTLAETRPAILRSLRQAFLASGFQPPAAETLDMQLAKGGTLATLLKNVAHRVTEEQEKEFVRYYRNFYMDADLEETVLFDGVIPTLEYLKRKNKDLIILSNKHAPTLKESIERFNLKSFFSSVLASEPQYPHKPDPRVMERVKANSLEGDYSRFLMVGDTAADLQFAKNVQISSCWARYGHGWNEQCCDIKFDYKINQITDLMGIIN